jgi:hypothetical protein
MASAGVVACHWDALIPQRIFPIGMAVFCPAMVAVGVGMIIEAPKLPVRKMTPLGWMFLVIGLIAVLLHAMFFREFGTVFG